MSLSVTEDTPPDMLAGSMDLNLVLPNGKTVKMSVQRGTPMMDLLVQVTTAHCLSPGDFSLQAIGDKGVLPFKPNTPIGALDTFTVKIVEKKAQNRGRAPQVPQSFLNTFRLQVHLPRSQLFVLRVTSDITLSEIMTQICTEKNLNLEKYEFRNPGKLDEVLELDRTLGYYKLQELSLVNRGNRTVTGLMSSADMITVKSSKHRQNSVCDSSLSSGSFGSRSGSPVPAINMVTAPPQPPIRKKRRPAPKPPSFIDKEKKDRNFSSVLISHSRESSDSSGYHEASVLSESPTHRGPGGSDSPPDTLPRRSKLPSSQSFTNLSYIQPPPKGRLISSVSNTSLNSNGNSRKKRAPPPPRQVQLGKDEKVKSSTLPASIAEEMRNGFSSFMTENFGSAKVDEDDDVPEDASDDNAKVQIPVEVTSRVVSEKTKATVDEDERPPATTDVDIKLPPKPKPRSLAPQLPATAMEKVLLSPKKSLSPEESGKEEEASGAFRLANRASPNQRSNVSKLTEEETVDERETSPRFDISEINRIDPSTKCPRSNRRLKGISLCDHFISDNPALGQRTLFMGKSDVHEDEISPVENTDQTDQDSINWEYQLPPPPTDFRDTNSPNYTEFGTITITPEVLENVDSYRKPEAENKLGNKCERVDKSISFKSPQLISEVIQVGRTEVDYNRHSHSNHHLHQQQQQKQKHNEQQETRHQQQSQPNRVGSETKQPPQIKSDVMSELTNILDTGRKQREKSLSVNNLYIKDPVADTKKSSLNYSRSFSSEKMSAVNNFKLRAGVNGHDYYGNNRKSYLGNEGYDDDEDDRNEITYRNYKNLEKSSSMECIDSNKLGVGQQVLNGKTEDVFRKPVAPVQKKLKMARRSASTLGVNTNLPKRRNPSEKEEENEDETWSDDPNINVLRQQFLEFLKERKLMTGDLKVNSLDVICNILPEVVNQSGSRETTQEKTDKISQERNAQFQSVGEATRRPQEEKVKVVDVKVKTSGLTNGNAETMESSKSQPTRHEGTLAIEDNRKMGKRESDGKGPQEKKQDLAKRYSYQGPPSINFATWGERPKTTRIIIKDEDYVTQAKLKEKKREMAEVQVQVPPVQVAQKPAETAGSDKPKEPKKTQIVIKKPGVLSHYEMFSALPKRKEITSLKLVFMDEEERRRLSQVEKEVKDQTNRVPVVCGIELKKEFKPADAPVKMAFFSPGPQQLAPPTAPPPPPPVAPEVNDKSNKHSVSVYVNGNREDKPTVGSKSNFIIPKRNPTLMPVVKGFRLPEENQVNGQRFNHVSTGSTVSKSEVVNEIHRRESSESIGGGVPPPPPPPVISAIKFKSTCSKSKMATTCQDPRSQLLDEIRNFGGLRKLNKAVVH